MKTKEARVNKMFKVALIVLIMACIGVWSMYFGAKSAMAAEKEVMMNNNNKTVVETMVNVEEFAAGAIQTVSDDVVNSPEYRRYQRLCKICNFSHKVGNTAGKVRSWGSSRLDETKQYYGGIKDSFLAGWNDAR